MINVKDLQVAYGSKVVIDHLSLEIPEGKITAVLGPNGCGKSTLINAISGHQSYKGQVLLDGKDQRQYKRKTMAKMVGYLPQNPIASEDCGVAELVSYGRYPHVPFGRRLSDKDRRIIDKVLKDVGLSHMKCRRLASLSGGERQRAFIAMALAQQTKVLILDEPTTYLDVAHQQEVLMTIQRVQSELSLTVVMVLHDMNQCLTYCDEVIGLKDGKVLCQGSPESVLNESMLQSIYGVSGYFVDTKMGKRVII